jgi:hypothetical protein
MESQTLNLLRENLEGFYKDDAEGWPVKASTSSAEEGGSRKAKGGKK